LTDAGSAAIAALPVACDGRSHLAGRTPEFVRQLATHEIGHAAVARSFGTTVLRTTIEPTESYAGRCFRRGAGLSHFDDHVAPAADDDESLLEICARLGSPPLGESPVEIAEGRARAEVAIVELVAGRVAEGVMLGDDIEPLDATLDYAEARALARTLCQPAAVDALIAFAEEEARAVIASNRDVVDALVDALVECGTLDAEQIDTTIIAAIAARLARQELARRADWRERAANAATFINGSDPTEMQRRAEIAAAWRGDAGHVAT
jgi:hypothetical protein